MLEKAGAIAHGHFVGTNGPHFDVYVAKDRALLRPSLLSDLALGIAERCMREKVDIVVGPAMAGIALSQWVAHHLTQLQAESGQPEVLAAYAEPNEETIDWADGMRQICLNGQKRPLPEGGKLIIRHPNLVLKRGFSEDVLGKNVLPVEDTLTTGGTLKRTIMAIREAGGIVNQAGAIANGGNVTAEDLGVKNLRYLVHIKRRVFSEADCREHGLCFERVPINTNLGHGKRYLESRGPA